MTLALLICAAFVAAPAVFLLTSRLHPAWTTILPAFLFCGFATKFLIIQQQGAIQESLAWIPELGITLAFRLDALSLLFSLLITGIGTFIFLYASAYLPRNYKTPRFFTTLTLFMAAMLGAVLADDLISLIVFWELTSLTSFLLIGYEPALNQARRSAQQGLLVTVGGGLALLAGAILLGNAAGTYQISEILNHETDLLQGATGYAIVLLIALGAFAKSAQAPLHAWLPNAMVAPTPVSAYLHSATMVKLGVYLLARLNPALSESLLWTPLLMGVGLTTMLTGTVLALRETDLKRVLAYSTIVSLGTLVTLIGTNHELAAVAMAAFLVIHALYKACLFMVAGIIDHEVGSRDASQLGGLVKFMPLTAIITCLAAFSMAGLPPLFGFVGKELIYEAGLKAQLPWLAIVITVLANACMVTIAGVIALRCFFGKNLTVVSQATTTPHDPSFLMWVGPLILAILGLCFGVMPWLIQGLVSQVASVVEGAPVEVSLSLWHGLTPMLALSLLTLMVGVAVFWGWDHCRRPLKALKHIDRWGTDSLYDKTLDALLRFAKWQTHLIQSGSLRYYMVASIGITSVSVLAVLFWQNGFELPEIRLRQSGTEVILPILLILASLSVLKANTFFKGIVAAGTVGFGSAVVFLFGGAPDLAFTQFSVESLSIVILLAIIGHMPFRDADPRTNAQSRLDAVVAIAFGLMLIAMLFSVVAIPFDETLSNFFREASYPQAHGRNLVNVIIVDFRALDTLGEITVLALAALAAVAVFFGAGERDLPSSHDDSTVIKGRK